MNKPTLSMTHDRKFWTLTADVQRSYMSFSLEVKYDAVETTFRKVGYIDGDRVELLTREELDERVEAVMEHAEVHEGNEPRHPSRAEARDMFEAAAGNRGFDRIEVITQAADDIFDELKRYWVALTMLLNPTIL